MRAAYNAGLHLLAVPGAPAAYLWARRRRPRMREALGHRLGRTAGLPAPPASPPLWLHGVSLGEVRALRPLVAAWRAAYPERPLLVSSSTETGLDAARSLYPDLPVTPFPLDAPWAVARHLDYWRPACLALLETELWPNMFWGCGDRGIPICVLSGRLSARSLRRAGWVRPLWRSVLARGAAFAMQTDVDAQRLLRLGAPADRISVGGNLKWDAAPLPAAAGETWRRTWGLSPATPLMLWGSTHSPEELLARRTWQALRAEFPDLRLCVAPRHPERFDAARAALGAQDVRVHRRSAGPAADWDILLLDNLGELATIYAAATVAVMGGTFAPVGGHNIVEPLAAGAPLIVGPHTHSIRQLVDTAHAAEAIVVTPRERLSEEAAALLRDADARSRLAKNGRTLLDAHRGTAARLVELLDQHWPADARCGA